MLKDKDKDKDRDTLTSSYMMTCWWIYNIEPAEALWSYLNDLDPFAEEAEEEIRLDVILLRPLADGTYVRRGTMVFAGDALKEVRHRTMGWT